MLPLNNHISSYFDGFSRYVGKTARGLLTGIEVIDNSIIGLPGFTTLMGEPKACKSTLALMISINLAFSGIPIIVWDRENGPNRYLFRLISNISGLESEIIRSNNFTPGELKQYNSAVETINALPIYYRESIVADELESYIKEIHEYHKKPVFLLVDSLQSIITDFKDRRASVDYWIFLFNELKNKYDGKLFILAVSEKQRAAYGVASRSGAKESGGIEYKSELVLDLYRRDKDKLIALECTHNRDGDTGHICDFKINKPYTYRLDVCQQPPF